MGEEQWVPWTPVLKAHVSTYLLRMLIVARVRVLGLMRSDGKWGWNVYQGA